MGLTTPEEIRFGRGVLTQLRRLMIAAYPREGCALLLGVASQGTGPKAGALWTLDRVWPCCNVWMPPQERLRRFALDPREQLLAQRWGRQRQLLLLGTAHSHPQGQPQPSATDRALAYTPSLQVILAPGDGWLPRPWWLDGTPDGAPEALPLPWSLDG